VWFRHPWTIIQWVATALVITGTVMFFDIISPASLQANPKAADSHDKDAHISKSFNSQVQHTSNIDDSTEDNNDKAESDVYTRTKDVSLRTPVLKQRELLIHHTPSLLTLGNVIESSDDA
jgi:hypothetical protein